MAKGGNTISLVFAGDATSLEKAFDKVGNSTTQLAGKVDLTTSRFNAMGRGVGDQEAGLQGMADLMDGLGATMGLPTEGLVKMTRGLADISGGISTVMPIIGGLSGLMPKLASAMTFVSSHPLMIGLLVGGAIIVGLVLLEKKFGIVSGAIGSLGDALKWSWENAIKPTLNLIVAGINIYLDAMTKPFEILGKIPGSPGWLDTLGSVKIPKLDAGGSVLQTGLAVVHRGEFVTSAGGRGPGGGMTVHLHVAGSVISERDLVRTVRDGLARERRLGA